LLFWDKIIGAVYLQKASLIFLFSLEVVGKAQYIER